MEDMTYSRWNPQCLTTERLWLRRLGQTYTMIRGVNFRIRGVFIWVHTKIVFVFVIVVN